MNELSVIWSQGKEILLIVRMSQKEDFGDNTWAESERMMENVRQIDKWEASCSRNIWAKAWGVEVAGRVWRFLWLHGECVVTEMTFVRPGVSALLQNTFPACWLYMMEDSKSPKQKEQIQY